MTIDDVAANRGARPTDLSASPPISASPPLRLSQQRCERNDDDVLEQKKTNGRTCVAGWAEHSESRVLVSRSPCRRRRAARRTHDIRSVSWHGRSRRRPGFSPGHCRERRWSLGVSRRRPPGSTASRRLVGCVRGDEEMKRFWFLRVFQCPMEWTGRKKRSLAFFSSPRCASPPPPNDYTTCACHASTPSCHAEQRHARRIGEGRRMPRCLIGVAGRRRCVPPTTATPTACEPFGFGVGETLTGVGSRRCFCCTGIGAFPHQ